MVTRTDITRSIIELLPGDQTLSLDQAIISWYRNIRRNGGLRLTDQGFEVLSGLELDSHQIPLTEKKISRKTLLDLDRKLMFPYYINTRKNHLTLFSSREAMLATLYGDTITWLESLQPRELE